MLPRAHVILCELYVFPHVENQLKDYDLKEVGEGEVALKIMSQEIM
jgi:hypothetical protein